MELPVRKHPRLREYNYNQPGYYFITICTRDRQPLFWRGPNQLSSLGQLALRCLEELPTHISGLGLDVHCVMHDHVHAILTIQTPHHPIVQPQHTATKTVGPPYMAAAVQPPTVRPPYTAAEKTARSKQTLSRAIQQYKAAVTRQSGQTGIWQRGFYDHILRNDADLTETRRYIQNNPLDKD